MKILQSLCLSLVVSQISLAEEITSESEERMWPGETVYVAPLPAQPSGKGQAADKNAFMEAVLAN